MIKPATLLSLAMALAVLALGAAATASDVPASPDPGGGTGNGTPPGVPNAVPATWDHLTCYKVKDARPFFPGPTVAVMAHEAFPASTCTIKKIKADELCVDVEKVPDPIKVGPIPPFGAYPANAGSFLCYKVVCDPKRLDRGFLTFVVDQFGARIIDVIKPRKLCVPLVDHVVLGVP